jgi:ribonuclease PH
MFNLKKISGMTIYIDTDVLQADGGTRCASVNGGMLAVVKVLRHLVFENLMAELPEIELLAAVSIGVKGNELLADLTYQEDFKADADISIISTEKGNIVEVETFAEEHTIPSEIFRAAIDLGIEKNLEIIENLKQYVTI